MKKIIFIFLLSVFFILFSGLAHSDVEEILKIHFIDVGEGDAILIEAPNNKAALVDTGNLITGFKVIEYLKEQGIKSLDHLILTHNDLDHIGGVFFVIQMINTRRIYDNGDDLRQASRFSETFRWYDDLVRKDKNYRILKAKDNLSLGKVDLKILWPSQPLPFSNFNPNSLVIMIEYGEFRCLLTGDFTNLGEREILQQDLDLRSDVLKVGHHGADDASSQEFLETVQPKVAIISVSQRYHQDYASRNVLRRLQAIGAKVYRTDQNGDILLTAQPNGQFEVETQNR